MSHDSKFGGKFRIVRHPTPCQHPRTAHFRSIDTPESLLEAGKCVTIPFFAAKTESCHIQAIAMPGCGTIARLEERFGPYFLRSGSTCSAYAVKAVSITWCMS